jgi:hypothetical protein
VRRETLTLSGSAHVNRCEEKNVDRIEGGGEDVRASGETDSVDTES